MKASISTWISEVRTFNKGLGLLGRGALDNIEGLAEETVSLLGDIREAEIADLGAGSGLMGIIFSILHPNSHVYLIERAHNKAVFLEHVRDKLGLDNTFILEGDPLKDTTKRFHALMSRAFSPITELEQAVRRSLNPKGRFYYISTSRPRLDSHLFRRVSQRPSGSNPRVYLYTYVMK